MDNPEPMHKLHMQKLDRFFHLMSLPAMAQKLFQFSLAANLQKNVRQLFLLSWQVRKNAFVPDYNCVGKK